MICARACCWSPFGCARQQVCDCHWGAQKPAQVTGGADRTYRDPTAAQAIHNVMKGNPR